MKATIPGWNPIYHNCDEQGCWNSRYRPPIHFFAGALPRKISMSDIDATVEVNGSFLFLEWKSVAKEIPTGQRIYFQRLTALSDKVTVVVVTALDAPTNVSAIQTIKNGKVFAKEDCDFSALVDRVAAWAKRVDVQQVAA